jgi:membrane protein insertase Oxa1/YidC/SpoIIIJ
MNKLTVNMEHQGLVFRTVLLKYKGISKGRRYSINVIHNTELLLTFLHQTTCLSWPVIIVGTTVTLRSLVTFPLALHQNKMVKRMELLQPTVKEYSEAIKHNVVVRGRRQGATPEEVNKQYKTQVLMIIMLYTHTLHVLANELPI